MKYAIVLIVFLTWVLFSCNPTKPLNNQDCTTIGTIKDHSGLDGCKFLIHLENGDRLEPAEISDKRFELKNGMKIKFSYELATDLMSICMGGKLVRVTCIQEL